MYEEIKPQFSQELEGFKFLGRGPEATGETMGWSRDAKFYYRCVKCGDSMNAAHNKYWSCSCKAVNLDKDMGRFGSWHGDINILVYEKID